MLFPFVRPEGVGASTLVIVPDEIELGHQRANLIRIKRLGVVAVRRVRSIEAGWPETMNGEDVESVWQSMAISSSTGPSLDKEEEVPLVALGKGKSE